MKNTISPQSMSENMNSFYAPNCHAGDIADEGISELIKAVAKNIPPDEQMRLSQPENYEEMVSTIHSLPEFKAIKKRIYKLLKKRTHAAMESVINSNQGCHSPQ